MSTATMRKVAADLSMYDIDQAYRTGRRYDRRNQAIRETYADVDDIKGPERYFAQSDRKRALRRSARLAEEDTYRAIAQKMLQPPLAKGMGYSPYAPSPLETGYMQPLAFKPAAPPVKAPSFNMRNMRNAGVGALLGGGLGYGMGGGWAGTAAGAAGGGLLAAVLGKYLRDKGIAKWASMHKQASATISGNREVTTNAKVSIADYFRQQEEDKVKRNSKRINKTASGDKLAGPVNYDFVNSGKGFSDLIDRRGSWGLSELARGALRRDDAIHGLYQTLVDHQRTNNSLASALARDQLKREKLHRASTAGLITGGATGALGGGLLANYLAKKLVPKHKLLATLGGSLVGGVAGSGLGAEITRQIATYGNPGVDGDALLIGDINVSDTGTDV